MCVYYCDLDTVRISDHCTVLLDFLEPVSIAHVDVHSVVDEFVR